MADVDGMRGVKHIVLVLSGKGGVGKSTLSTQIAVALRDAGKRVGILDIDLCGPSIPKMFGVSKNEIHVCDEGWVPVFVDKEKTLSLMSIAFLLKNVDDPIVWRGPKKNAMIKQFLQDVVWGDLDFLIIDTPPGTSDEHISVVEHLREYNPDGAVLVTTPQGMAVADVRKELNFCKRAKLKVLGIVENMSGYVCPCCAEVTNVFSSGGGERLATDFDVPFLGRVPIDPAMTQMQEKGENYAESLPTSNAFKHVQSIIGSILQLDKDDNKQE